MTKEQAFQAMIDGEKITHKYFMSNEYLYMIAQNIYTEDDYNTGTVNCHFWKSKSGGVWENDWSIYAEK